MGKAMTTPIIYDFDQYSPEWWSVRRGVPTASEFHRIITAVKGQYASAAWGYICELCADRLRSDYGQTDDYLSRAMERGNELEPEARKHYSLCTGDVPRQVGFVLNDGIGCSPDALIGADGGLECKSPEGKKHMDWLLRSQSAPRWIPEEHIAQVHGCLIVTGREWWDFMSYHPDMPHVLVRVEPDAFTDKLRACLDKFKAEYAEMWRIVEGLRGDAKGGAL